MTCYGTWWSTSATPSLAATANDADPGTQVTMTFVLYRGRTNTEIWRGTAAKVMAGQVGSVKVPAGKLAEKGEYSFSVIASDGIQSTTSDRSWSMYVDTTAPAAPIVTSTAYPSNDSWNGVANQAGSFTATMPAPDDTQVVFEWGLDNGAVTNRAVAFDGTTAFNKTTFSVTPPTNGPHTLKVRSLDKAGNRSPIVEYRFNVGRAGLVSPVEGDQVVRRVRLDVQGQSAFSYVRYAWRRGPDAPASQAIALGALTKANGDPVTTTWTSLSAMGDYATWDAGLTLGHVPGPVQVQAIVAKDANGTEAYGTQWVTVTVSPDADHAASDDVGPGAVNLLTGDYILSSTDVDEFGLSLGRTASSRQPRAGLEPQRELLSLPQQTMSDATGYTGGNATFSRIVGRWHSGGSALQINPNGSSSDSYVELKAPDLAKGATYRVTGWIQAFAHTIDLTPDNDARGLRIYAEWRDAAGKLQSAVSNAPTRTDMWQQLTLEFTVPADAASGARIRLYNGFTKTSEAMAYDDISVREIWSPLGPEWSLGVADEMAGTAYDYISLPYPDVASLHLAGGGELWFTQGANGQWWPQPGAESLSLTSPATGQWRLTEIDGTVSQFAVQPGSTNAKLTSTSPPAASGATRLVYETVNGRLRLTRLIAAVEPGVDNWPTNQQACTGAVPAVGCEVMQLVYSTSTTATASRFGSYGDRLSEVRLWSAVHGDAATSAVGTVRYAYDDRGRLREVWDPRIEPALKTTYAYDGDGRVTTMTPPGELPWSFDYGTGGANSTIGKGDLVDRSSGRLLRVSRASLVPGTVGEAGPDTTTTLVYAVPLTRSAGGPYDLGPADLATWAQNSAPTDAIAVFGPEDVPSVTTAEKATPGADGYRAATVHYLDSSGREVNTATPAGPDAPAAGFIDTAEQDRYGNVVRSLDATNRLLALDQMPSSAADLAELNLTQSDSAARAEALSTLRTYGAHGLDLLSERGPLLQLAVGNDPNNVRLVHDLVTYVYDAGKPDGLAYHLVTTQTEALLVAGAEEELLDVEVTVNGYDPIDGASKIGPTSGWKTGQPTSITYDAGPGGANLKALVRYDAQGRAVESRRSGSTGTDAGTNLALYYTAGTHPTNPACGGKPAYAGLPCMNYVAGAVTGHNASRMATNLPVKQVTAYNRYGSAMVVTETATGPLNGSTVTQSRTTTTEYDAADRVASVTITGSNAGQAVARTVNRYDPATGDVTVIDGVDPASGSVRSSVKKTFDQLGRMTRYEDGNGGWTASVFDRYGKPVEVTDSLGTTASFTYDRAKEPRGFLTSVQDSVAGTISATYGPDGQVTSQTLPGGVELRIGYDANRAPVTRTYLRSSDEEVIASSAVVENSSGQWVTHTTAAGAKQFTYDRLERLTDVRDLNGGTSTCAWRKYAYNDRGGRTALKTAVSDTSVCADPGAVGTPSVSAVSYTYDSADRLVTESAVPAGAWVYDPLGRTTTAPVRGSPGATVANEYFVNDLVAAQTIPGVARQTWALDAIGRFASYSNAAWAVGGDGVAGWQEAVTKVSHYDSDSDSPAWIAEDVSLPDEVTRYVDGLDGSLAVQTGKSGSRVLQLIDLHGDVMATLPIRDGESTAYWAGLVHQAADEFGNSTDLTTGAARATDGSAPGREGRYGWLGGAQRSADALAGVILMGVRLYDPGTGRFWSPDPEPGGNATAYDYCSADPVNCTDLDGRWSFFKKMLKKVAVVTAVVATVVPGPIGAAAGAISAGAYAATGNKRKALEMSITAAAAMVPGGGAMVKVGMAAARSAGKVSARAGRSVVKAFKGRNSCRLGNSFSPGTGVLMADGTTQPISQIDVGDLVTTRDPETGEVTWQPVLDVIVGHGEKHLIKVVTAPAQASALDDGQVADGDARADTWIATANHPIWVEGEGWTEADDLALGDLLMGAAGDYRVVQDLDDRGWLLGQTVYNLSVANVHTFVVGDEGAGSLVHNCSAVGPSSQQANLRALIKNDTISKTIRGELANLARQGKRLRVDGMQMAHRRTHEAARGCGYQCSVLQTRQNHMRQHKYDNWGKKNRRKRQI
ncbi:polymorphic toxin-type HINT domain-containing protein [Modestobacter sp. SYSU DS0875]